MWWPVTVSLARCGACGFFDGPVGSGCVIVGLFWDVGSCAKSNEAVRELRGLSEGRWRRTEASRRGGTDLFGSCVWWEGLGSGSGLGQGCSS